MSINILKKRHIEAEIENRTNIDGEWKVEIVCSNGEIKKPLGEKWRKNLIQDAGLNIFNGTYASFTSAPSTSSISNFIQSAYFGNSNADPFATNKTFLTSSNANIYWTKRNTLNVPENTNPNSDDPATGSRTFTKVWDFPSLAAGETRDIKEIAISANTYQGVGSSSLDQYKGSQGTLPDNMPLISRFILPSTITLTEFQFLRLYYSIKITVPAIVTPVPITLSNNGFDGTGQLKLIGLWSSIFSGNGHLWQYRLSSSQINVASTPHTPWSLIGRDGIAAAMLKGNSDPNLNFQFPAVGADFNITYANALHDATQTVLHTSPGCSLNPVSTVNGTIVGSSVSREATLLFQANNPSVNSPLAGIVFLPVGAGNNLTGGSIPTYTNAVTTDIAFSRYMWYWRFTDPTFSSPRSVIKDTNYGLVINLRQTISRG
jgi:hypothetical protein